MSEYFFGVGRGELSSRDYNKVRTIAKKHGATFVNPDLPGEGPRYWFAVTNYGEPNNSDVERAVMRDLEKAGVKLP